jgi:hypothetical protein
MKTRTNILVIALTGAFLLASPGYAAPTIFSGSDVGSGPGGSSGSRVNSNAAANAYKGAANALHPTHLITFEAAPVGFISNTTIAPGVTVDGQETEHPGMQQQIRSSPYHAPGVTYGYNTTVGGSKFLSEYTGTITFTFATPIDSFGAYFTGVQNSSAKPQNVRIEFNDGANQVIPFPHDTLAGGIQFQGFTDAGAQITSSTIQADTDSIGIDNVRFGYTEECESNLVSFSTRAILQTDENPLTTLFTLAEPRTVLLVALGPSLNGAAASVQDPILELRDADGNLIASNDNWKDSQEAEISATGLAPRNIHESAILRQLPSSRYTAIVRGVNNTSGLAEVQVTSVRYPIPK